MRANVYFTTGDQQQGYPATKAALKLESNEDLVREYRAGMKLSADPMFGRTARAWQNLIGGELLSRGVTEIQNNPFGPIAVKADWR